MRSKLTGRPTALFYALSTELVDLLIASGGDLTLREENFSQQPIHAISGIFSAKVAVVEKLLAHGADINSRDSRGDTPLIRAVISGNREVISLLLSKGADPSIRNADGKTAVDYASQSRREFLNLFF